MDQQELIELTKKVKNGSASPEEREQFFSMLANSTAAFNDFLEKEMAVMTKTD